jgi:hypothetical protein
MTDKQEMEARRHTLIKKAKQIQASGCSKRDCYKMLKNYHNQWFTTGYHAQRQDLVDVTDKVYPDELTV